MTNKIILRDAEAVGAAMNPQGHIVFSIEELELYTARAVSDVHDLILEGGHTDLFDILQQWGVDYVP